MSDNADLASDIVQSAFTEVARLTEQLRIRDVHIKALEEMLKKRNDTISELRKELAKHTKGTI